MAQILQFGIKMEIIDSNPMRKTELPRKIEVEQFPNFYTKEQLETFFNCLEDHIEKSGRTSHQAACLFPITCFYWYEKIRSFSFTVARY